jgi:phospholipid/cholesterol/gamma-HCH transport system substrate-binding protein
METKVNYVIVGLFALLLSAALIAGVLWLSAGKQYNLAYDTYMAYMYESVSGLNLNAPVKYRGVDVGQVKSIALDKNNPEQVRLEFAIERGIQIKEDTIATMRTQGLTGIAYIELSGGSKSSPLLKTAVNEQYPLIKTGPSLLGRLDTALTSLLTSLNKTSENLNALLDEENRQALKHTLANVSTLTAIFVARKAELDKTARNSSLAMENAAAISTQMPELIQRIARSTEAVEKMAKEIARTSASVRQTVDGVGPDAQRFTNEGLPELEKMLLAMRAMMDTLHRVTEQIERNPSMLLRGQEAPQPGPGE